MGKTRMNITIDRSLREQMELIKDGYGGFSGLIEHAVVRFLQEPVEPYDDDVSAYEASLDSRDAVSLDAIDWDEER